MQGTVFAVAGGEAIDLSIKLARGHTGRSEIVSYQRRLSRAHGAGPGDGRPAYRDPFGPNLPGFSQVPFNDIDALRREVGEDTAAGAARVDPRDARLPDARAGLSEAVEDHCRSVGALLILDEVQTGMGRTGTFWYYQQEEVEPDMVVAAKGLGGGSTRSPRRCRRGAARVLPRQPLRPRLDLRRRRARLRRRAGGPGHHLGRGLPRRVRELGDSFGTSSRRCRSSSAAAG